MGMSRLPLCEGLHLTQQFQAVVNFCLPLSHDNEYAAIVFIWTQLASSCAQVDGDTALDILGCSPQTRVLLWQLNYQNPKSRRPGSIELAQHLLENHVEYDRLGATFGPFPYPSLLALQSQLTCSYLANRYFIKSAKTGHLLARF